VSCNNPPSYPVRPQKIFRCLWNIVVPPPRDGEDFGGSVWNVGPRRRPQSTENATEDCRIPGLIDRSKRRLQRCRAVNRFEGFRVWPICRANVNPYGSAKILSQLRKNFCDSIRGNAGAVRQAPVHQFERPNRHFDHASVTRRWQTHASLSRRFSPIQRSCERTKGSNAMAMRVSALETNLVTACNDFRIAPY
jgi:hypothetical protein